MNAKHRHIRVSSVLLSAGVLLLVSFAVALSAPGGNGGKQKIDPVLYWVSFPADPLAVYWGHDPAEQPKITGKIDRPEDPALLVGRTYPDEKAHAHPKHLRLDDDFAFDPGAGGGDDLDIAFPEDTYIGAMAVNSSGTWVQIGLKGFNRDGKRQSYVLHAEVDPLPATWDPLAMNSGDTVTLSLGAWELRPGDTGAAAKAVHAWGNFDQQTQIQVEKQ